MGYEVLGQEQIFWYACILGVFLGILYDIFRIIRLAIKCNSWYIFVQDILYFIISGVATFLFLLSLNSGRVRIYILCGELIGWVIYYITLGELVYKCSGSIIRLIKNISRKICWVIWKPFLHIFQKIGYKLNNKKTKNNKM